MISVKDEKVLQEIKKGKVDNIRTMEDVSVISTLTEDEVSQIVSKLTFDSIFLHSNQMQIFFEHANVSEKVMKTIIENFPILLTNKSINPKITPKIKQMLLDDFCNNPAKYKEQQHLCGCIWFTMEMSEDMWKQVIAALRKPGAPDFRNWFSSDLEKGVIFSDIVAEYVIEGSYYYTGFPLNAELTKKYFDLWLKKDDEYYFSKVLSYSEDYSLALNAYPQIYQYIKSPTAADAEIIINVDPENLSLVKKQTEKICLLALKKDKRVFKYVRKPTKKILAFMGMATKKASLYAKYPAKQYLVTCTKDVADEGDITYIGVVPGKEMADFMSQKVKSYGFSANFDCYDGVHYVEDYMKAQAISDDELAVLEKFKIFDLNTGFFSLDGYED